MSPKEMVKFERRQKSVIFTDRCRLNFKSKILVHKAFRAFSHERKLSYDS